MSRSVKVCNKIMNHLVEQGFTRQVTKREVEKAIIMVRGPDKRTLMNWLRALETLGYLEKVSTFVFNMNLKKCPDLLVRLMKVKSQKKLM